MSEQFDRIYIRGFPSSYTSDSLRVRFREYGPIKSVYITNNEGTAPFGIVRYKNINHGSKAVEAANGKQENDITWYVAKCDKKSERHSRTVQLRNEKVIEWKKANLFVKGLPSDITNERIKAHFEIYGEITSISIKDGKVFVCFAKDEDAKKAFDDAKTRLFEESKLNVTFWMPKNELMMKIRMNKLNRGKFKAREERRKKKKEEEEKKTKEEPKEGEKAEEKQETIEKEETKEGEKAEEKQEVAKEEVAKEEVKNEAEAN